MGTVLGVSTHPACAVLRETLAHLLTGQLAGLIIVHLYELCACGAQMQTVMANEEQA